MPKSSFFFFFFLFLGSDCLEPWEAPCPLTAVWVGRWNGPLTQHHSLFLIFPRRWYKSSSSVTGQLLCNQSYYLCFLVSPSQQSECHSECQSGLWPYHPEHARSHLISEAKQDRAWLLLGWENVNQITPLPCLNLLIYDLSQLEHNPRHLRV